MIQLPKMITERSEVILSIYAGNSLSFSFFDARFSFLATVFTLSLIYKNTTMRKAINILLIFGFTISILFQSCTKDSDGNGTPVNPGTVTDASGNTYPTVTIGTQVWMAENLRTTKYRDGSNIPVVTSGTTWANNSNNGNPLQQPMMCWYNNDQATYTANKFGALYNWYAINPATNGNKNVCPIGWHVPTNAEWTTLTTFLGGESVAGGKMKSTGTQYWLSPNRDATNSSGWSGLPGGYRFNNGTFNFIGLQGYWWSSTESSTNYAWSRGLGYGYGVVDRGNNARTYGFSVRCVRD
jgi:uncharacterized protein (TIGR02145 family)